MNYENIKKKIKSIFSSESEKTAQYSETKIKSELTFYTKETTIEEDVERENNDVEDNDEVADAFYTHDKYKTNPRF